MSYDEYEVVSDKDLITTLLLCYFAGIFGVHHFYCGRTGKGILYILTFGLFGIGAFIDLLLIAMRKYKDGEGKRVCVTDFFEPRR